MLMASNHFDQWHQGDQPYFRGRGLVLHSVRTSVCVSLCSLGSRADLPVGACASNFWGSRGKEFWSIVVRLLTLKVEPVLPWSLCLAPMLDWLFMRLVTTSNSLASTLPSPLRSNILGGEQTYMTSAVGGEGGSTKSICSIGSCMNLIQRGTKQYVNLAKQDPGKARRAVKQEQEQNSYVQAFLLFSVCTELPNKVCKSC